MTVNILKRKWHKVTAVISFILILLVFAFSLFVNSHWSPILAKKLKEVVATSSGGLYNVDFSSAELRILRGSIVFYNITLKPDTAVYNSKKKLHLAPNNLVELHIKRLTLSHIHPLKLYFKKKLDIGEVIINNPEVHISYQLNHTKDTVLKDNRTTWQKISKSLRSIHVGNIIMGDIKFRYDDYSGNKLAISELKEMNVSAHELLIDSTTQKDKSRMLYCKEIIAELNNYTFKTANGLYSGKIDHIKLSTLKSQLNIEGLTLKPINAEDFFAKSHKDKFTMHIDSVQLNHFDFLSYHKYRTLNASNLLLKNGAIEIFSNPNHFKPPTDRVATFPNIGIYKINANMKIDTAFINQINITYTEFNAKSNKTGSIYFNHTSGRVLNLTTNPVALQKNNVSSVQLTSYFMNRGKFNLQMSFNLTDDDKTFDYKGSLGPMDLKIVNSATVPLTMVKMTSGTLKQFDFDIHANKNKATGKITLLYNNAKVALLKIDTVSDNLKQRAFASLYANIFILKRNNPDIEGGPPRSVFVNFERESDFPFFKYIWQTLLSGIKPSIGLDKKTQDATVEMTNQQAIYQQNRKVKKEQRLRKRAERRKKREEKKLAAGN
ncbi:hypothetical protein JN11_02259 [Mucilaginibacter frigoritolerans]|uniref:AsmA-like protein n=1 Tax=Mucilaginibacter frigoritolerans TaxID=652788 RepID=A0A562U3G9_9SPHI|nr:hypothetical protein [Mucilaginibacter frigoritolerans]TWI99844.1 hypothetical protein JN11_02259 [Mucilaginibacter frigoritolerans]